MLFQEVWEELKKERCYGTKKKDMEDVYELLRKRHELEREFEIKKKEIMDQVFDSYLYRNDGFIYCRMLEVMNEQKLF